MSVFYPVDPVILSKKFVVSTHPLGEESRVGLNLQIHTYAHLSHFRCLEHCISHRSSAGFFHCIYPVSLATRRPAGQPLAGIRDAAFFCYDVGIRAVLDTMLETISPRGGNKFSVSVLVWPFVVALLADNLPW